MKGLPPSKVKWSATRMQNMLGNNNFGNTLKISRVIVVDIRVYINVWSEISCFIYIITCTLSVLNICW